MVAGSAAAAVVGVLGIGAAAAVAPGGGTDLAGIALVITAVSGLIATVGALLLGLRRKPSDAADLALRLLLEQQAERMHNKPEEDPE